MKFSNSTSDLSSFSLSSTITKEGQPKRSSLADALSSSLHSGRGSSSLHELKQRQREFNHGSSHEGLVANRRLQITRRLSMDNTASKLSVTASKQRLSHSKSLDMAPGGELGPNDLIPAGSSHTRFSALRERFNNSNASLSLSSGFDSSFSTLGDPDSRHSGHRSTNSVQSIPEIAMTDSDDDDDDDDSINSFGEEETEASESFHMNSNASLGMNSQASGDLEEHEAGLQKLLDMEHSFNESFLKVGGSGKDCRQTRKGSVFVMADAKLANTKIVKTKLDKAARTIQRFFRYSKAILSRVRDEVEYWNDEQKDIERRRLEELEDVQRFLEVQKQRFALQLDHEEIRKLQDELDAKHKLVAELEDTLRVEKDKNEELKESIRTLAHKNKKLSSEAEDPIRADKVKALDSDILSLTAKKNQREDIVAQARKTIALFHRKIQKAEKQTGKVQSQRQPIKECLRKIIKLVGANPDKFVDNSVMEVMHSELSKVNSKLARKVKKRITKATEEQSSSSIQAQTSMEGEASSNLPQESKVPKPHESVGVVSPESTSRSLTKDSTRSSLENNDREKSALFSLISTSEHSKTKKSKTPRRSSSLHSALEQSKSKEGKQKRSSSLKAALAESNKQSETSRSKKKRSSSSSSKKKKKSVRSISQPEGGTALMSLITGDDAMKSSDQPVGGGGALVSLIHDSNSNLREEERRKW